MSGPKSTLANVRTQSFHRQFAALPQKIQAIAEDKFQTFLVDPFEHSLKRHPLDDTKRGRHLDGSVSVSVTYRYRAIFYRDESTGTNVWYWIGTHEDYNNFTGKK